MQPAVVVTHSHRPSELEKCVTGAEVSLGAYHFRCLEALGRGSFGEVWSAEILAPRDDECRVAALKDVAAHDRAALDQALFEIRLLSEQHGPDVRVPRLLAHHVAGRRVRIAMTRLPGETLGKFLSRSQPVNQDGPSAIRRGGALATLLLRQLGPTLERVSRLAWHRDVNPRNVLLSDDAGGLMDSRACVRSARFWLIDFGLAVDSRTWGARWATSSIGGDCRYWPASAWLMWLQGPEAVRGSPQWLRQYQGKLDSYALGVTALELLCTPALALDARGSEDELRGSWRRLLTAHAAYMRDVSRWHRELFRVFSTGADARPLHHQLSQERAAEVVQHRVSAIRSCLRACMARTHDPSIQNLLWAIAELLDESSNVALMEAVQAVSDGSHPGHGASQSSRVAPAASLDAPPPWIHGSLANFAPVARRSLTPLRQRSESARSHAPQTAQKGRNLPGQPSFVPHQDLPGDMALVPVVPRLCFPPPMAHSMGRPHSLQRLQSG